MGSPAELSLDYKPNGYSTAKKPNGEQPEQSQKLEELLAGLEEERLKIDAFKRELPLCMQLLNTTVETYRQQLEVYHTNEGAGPVLEEFIPLKHASNHTDVFEQPPATAKLSCEKASWMTSAQLWSPADDGSGGVKHSPALAKDFDHRFDANPRLVLDCKQRNGGAFIPFRRDRRGVLPELALAPVEEEKLSDVEVPRTESSVSGCGGEAAVGAEHGKPVAASAANQAADGGQAATTAQTQRKARRCWSPDLHRRFVNALQMLGGSQVATPKQIRELMKVDGLTNDEVKSHLQKYRLHTRRPIPAPQAGASAAAPHLVVLGGIWVPPEFATTAAAATPGIYVGHPSPAHYCTAPAPQGFYSPLPPPPQHHRGGACNVKVKRECLEGEVVGRSGGGDNCDSIENLVEEEDEGGGRSESSSWKGGDDKALVPVTEDGEVSNGSDVTLKF